MDQHPVPQNISSYEFRLVGDMTLKQFFQLAGGIVVALIIYRTNLPFIIKWPMVLASALVGVLLAFVPVNGRPFSQWIMAFLKAIYTPTEFYWAPSLVTEAEPATAPIPSTPPKAQTPLDKFEEQLFSRFTQLFSGQTISVPPPVISDSRPTAPLTMPEVDIPPQPTVQPSAPQPAAPIPRPVQPLTPTNTSPDSPTPPPPVPTTLPITPTRPTPIPVLDRRLKSPADNPGLANLPLPSQPNILIGQVLGPTGQLAEGVIVEIAESPSGLPVRALRTNKLGQFQIATPLPAGNYTIQAEKDDWVFTPLAVVADNKIISPILITAKTT